MQTECNIKCKNNAMLENRQNECKQSATQSANKSASNNGPSGIDQRVQNERNPSAIRLQFECSVKKECNSSAKRMQAECKKECNSNAHLEKNAKRVQTSENRVQQECSK